MLKSRMASLIAGVAVAFSIQTSASAFTPSPQLRQYQQVTGSTHARRNVAVWDVWQTQGRPAGEPLELRGMVDGTMDVGGKQTFFLRIGVHRIPVEVGRADFGAAPGTAVYCVARVMDARQVPPVLRLEAYVRTDEMEAWQAEQAREAEQARARAAQAARDRALQAERLSGMSRMGMMLQTAWSKEWASGDENRQVAVACRWMQSFNPSLPDTQAEDWARTILREARSNKVDPRLLMSLMAAESAFQSTAVSPVGAQGLGQLMPDTATRLGVSNAFDPIQNIHGSCLYVGRLMNMWGSKPQPLSLVLASYNAGEGAVAQYGGVPPYAETQNYVAYVLSLYRELGGKGI